MRQKIKLLAGCLGMMVLILDSRLALSAATNGVEICLRAVIPSLFPFFFFSGMLTDALKDVRLPFSKHIGGFLRIDSDAVSIWLIGLLGGYPVGAQAVGHAVANGRIHPSDGRRMLAFCNNCGPAFIFGIVGSAFESAWIPFAIWAIHLTSSVLCALTIPGSANKSEISNGKNTSMPDTLKRSISVTAQVCGWIILFRVLLGFCEQWFGFLMPKEIMTALSGLLELSNGCLNLSAIDDTAARFTLCSGMLGFGGLCVTMQTLSVCPNTLKTDLYLSGKILQSGCSLLLSCLLMYCVYRRIQVGFLIIGMVLTVIPFIILRIYEKRSRFLCAASI